MQEKRKLFFNLLLATLFVWIPIKLYNSIHKQEYLDHNFDVYIGEVNWEEATRIIKDLKKNNSEVKN